MIYRNTIQKRLVLDTVRRMTNHPTVEEIYERIVMEHPSVSKGTVYRNLNILAQQGEILRVQFPNAADRYDFNTRQHYHIRCRYCGKVDDVEMPYLEHLQEQITDCHGFQPLSHQIVFEGICPACNGIALDKI